MPYKDPEKQRQAVRKAMQKKRALDKQRKEELDAEREYIEPVSEKFKISWERFKELFPDAKFSDYLEEKRKFEKENKGEILEPQIEQVLQRNRFPLKNFDCKRFRLQIRGFIHPKDSFFCANHHTSCESCQKWFHEWKDCNKGANPW